MVLVLGFFVYASLIFSCFCFMKGPLDWAGFLGSVWFTSGLSFCLDNLGMIFSLMLVCCGFSAILFSDHYFGGSEANHGLLVVMGGFLSVMLFLVCSHNVVLTLVYWEYLGFVSFLLILYYSNMSSLRAAVVTLVSSRFGDVGLFVFIGCLLNDCCLVGVLVGVCLFLIVSSKSACYPFMSWLLEAMRAPTPVSSLVHSSTLVAAGVWFVLRYESLLVVEFAWLVYLMCFVTILVSALCSCFIVDVKKIVAFSTCNNISWCLLYVVEGDVVLSLCQLLVHGLCKCLLFMVVGDSMVAAGSSQSGVNLYSLPGVSWLGSFVSSLLICCLCGVPFLGVFVTKHLFLAEGVVFVSFLGLSSLVVGVLLTFVYSFRFASVLLGEGGGLSSANYVSFFLCEGFVFLSFWVVFVIGGLLEESLVLNWWEGFVLLVLQVLGCFLGVCLYASSVSLRFIESLSLNVFGSDVIVESVYSLFNRVGSFVAFIMFRWERQLMCWCQRSEIYYFSLFYGYCGSLGWLLMSASLVIWGACLLF